VSSPPASAADVADIRNLPQDCNAWLDRAAGDTPLISPQEQAARYAHFRKTWMSPWAAVNTDAVRDEAAATLDRYARDPGYGEDLRPHKTDWIGGLARLAALSGHPRAPSPAITIRNTNLRELPTAAPHFNDPSLPGEGFPFDNLQKTALWAGTPACICHYSADGAWALVATSLASGWAPAADVLAVDRDLIEAWQAAPWAAVVRDRTAFRERSDAPARFVTHVGAVFPIAAKSDRTFALLIPVDNARGGAAARQCAVPADAVAAMPVPFTPAAVARGGNQMLGQPYGWGGLLENRDCSAMVRDLMTPFGLFLPRNSGQQARAGALVPVDPSDRQRLYASILEHARPWSTLLWCDGHIMLYVGQRDGQPIILHSPWGVRTRRDGREGRHVIGRCSITTLTPGAELPDWDPHACLAAKIKAVVRLDR
jgi:cell wall-associated NlpC family hydrolase